MGARRTAAVPPWRVANGCPTDNCTAGYYRYFKGLRESIVIIALIHTLRSIKQKGVQGILKARTGWITGLVGVFTTINGLRTGSRLKFYRRLLSRLTSSEATGKQP